MAWTPISLLVPQFVDSSGDPYANAVLKAYQAGTSTNIAMATDSTGGTTFNDISLNANGYPEHSGSVVIPHVNQDYKIALFANQTNADANTPAIWAADNLDQINLSGVISIDDSAVSSVTNVLTLTHTVDSTPVAGVGTGIALVTETSADNNETGLIIESVATDVSAGSEDFKLVIKLMAAGAAAAQVLSISSTGAVRAVGQVQWVKGADVASANALPVLTDGNYFDVTGTTAITSINTTAIGSVIKLHFDGALTLTHHATDLILPGGANITTAAGDEAEFVEYATGDYRCTKYQRAAGVIKLSDDASPQLSAELDGDDNTVSKVNLKDYGEITNAIGSIGGGTQDIDLTLGNCVTATVDTSTTTFTFSNSTASDERSGFRLYLTNGGSQTVNWPASVDWSGASAPTLTTSGLDILDFDTVDGGTTWHGVLVSGNSS